MDTSARESCSKSHAVETRLQRKVSLGLAVRRIHVFAALCVTLAASFAFAQSTSYVKISNSGARLPANAQVGDGPNDWGCTLIATSGEMWVAQRPGGPNARDRVFTYYTSATEVQKYDGTTYSTPSASELASADNAPVYIADANTRSMCGRTNWSFGNPVSCNTQSCGVLLPTE
jgi:hypothetical protein